MATRQKPIEAQELDLWGAASQVRQVSAARAKCLAKLGVHSAFDLLTFYPHRYVDLTNVVDAASAPIGQTATVIGKIADVKQKTPRPRMHIIEVALVDDTGMIQGVWFRQPWMINKLHPGDTVAFTGKVAFDYGLKKMNSPYMEVVPEGADQQLAMIPIHHATEGLTGTWVRRLIANGLEQAGSLEDPLPAALRSRYGLMGRKAALRNMHFPSSTAAMEQARRRLAYEEVLRLQLEMMMRRDAEVQGQQAHSHVTGPATQALWDNLPFTLTDEQQAAVADITSDMQSGTCMNRMLLGDVGTGKTIVAAFALALCADSGTQVAMMAPTEVLAQQYGEKLGELLDACGVSWCVLTGSTSADKRLEYLEGLAAGSITVAFGTHALIEPDVAFKAMTLAVIDEQHRFGVEQRSALRAKGEGSDLLVMTATPIPRTLALTLYGDLHTTYIRQRPANRPPTTTQVVSRNARGRAYEAIKDALKQGRQAYIICPLVGLDRNQRNKADESGELAQALRGVGDIADLKAATQEAEMLQRKIFAGYKVGLLTGRMTPSQKQQVMEEFRAGSIDVLVATTVVEVGIDVPNATLMMIEDAERFGLSQLHQLRGRVGRGQYPGHVFLVADPGADDIELKDRLNAMETISDGFELAEADLRARREGDVLGSRQHGAATLKLVNVLEDAALIATAHKDASQLLATYPGLDDPQVHQLKMEIDRLFADASASLTQGA